MKPLYRVSLFLIFVLGAFLRLHHLRTVPAWYPDEGSNIAVAASLFRGEPAYLVFGQSSFINPRPYLFYLPVLLLFELGGVDILWVRLVSALCGLSALVLLYPLTRDLVGHRAALFAVLFHAIYPAAVVYSRFAFTYNLLPVLYLLGLHAFHRYLDSHRLRALMVFALCAGLSLVTDLAGVAFAAFLVVALLVHRPRHLLPALPLVALPVLVWGVWMWLIGGDAFLFDLQFAFSRTSASLGEQLGRVIFVYRVGLEEELWLAMGAAGLLMLSERRARWLLGGLFFGSLFIVIARVGAISGIAAYFLIPLFPLVSIGVGGLLAKGVPWLVDILEADIVGVWGGWRLRPSLVWRRRIAFLLVAAILFLVVFSPLVSLASEGILWNYGLFVGRLGATLADPAMAEQTAAYVNARTGPGDVVLCSPTIAWLFEANAADFQMAVAATGRATQHFPADIPASRFRFDPRLENAAYVILDPFWRGWASKQMPEVAEMVREVEREWVLEGRFGAFEVYRRPPGQE